jgi:hypothetical protein
MQPFSWARVLLAGLAAGVVIDSLAYIVAIEFFLEGAGFAKPWAEAIQAVNNPSLTPTNFIAIQQIGGFPTGLLAIGLYAKMRSRWAPILIAWAVTSVIGCGVLMLEKIPLSMVAVIAGLIEVALGTLLGSWIYREAEAAMEQPAVPSLLE